MALREIRQMGDSVLTKECKPIKEMSSRLKTLIMDMIDTMYEAEGVGLAAPQVGILKRVVVVDIGDEDPKAPYILINPELLEADGEQTDYEGCLSLPGKFGKVTRPDHVKVRCQNLDMETVEYEAQGFLARAFCHEIDHLGGHMFVEKVEGDLVDAADFQNEDDEEE